MLVVCLACTQLHLTLELPVTRVEVSVVHVDGSTPLTLHAVEVSKAGSVGSIYAALAMVWSSRGAAHQVVSLAGPYKHPFVCCPNMR